MTPEQLTLAIIFILILAFWMAVFIGAGIVACVKWVWPEVLKAMDYIDSMLPIRRVV